MFVVYSEQYEVTDKKDNNHWLKAIVLKGDNKR
jgi:hypothetical protein